MKNLHDLYDSILADGFMQGNRTTERALCLPYGATLHYDMIHGFPIATTKKVAFKGAIAENIGFLRGYTNSEHFAALGCPWWDKDANQNTDWLASPYRTGPGDMGRAYGSQWRRWATVDGKFLDQIQMVLDLLRKSPQSRRIIFTAWRPDEFKAMCLPPCHMVYNFSVNVGTGELSLGMYQRSVDSFLGLPMNIVGSAFLLHLFAKAAGLTPRHLTLHLDNVHIYEDHIPLVQEQVSRDPHLYELPKLVMLDVDHLETADADILSLITPDQFLLDSYCCYPAIKGNMSTSG